MSEKFSIHADTKLIEGLFKARGYEVPPYQRNYAWTHKQCEQLWADLMALHADPKEVHFLGSVVFVEKNPRLDIVDGQQRLATLSLLFAAIVSALEEEEPIVAAEIRSDCLTTFDKLTKTHHPKLRLNQGDDGAFSRIVTQIPQFNSEDEKKSFIKEVFTPGIDVVAPSESSKNIIENYHLFLKNIKREFTTAQKVIEFNETIVNRVQTVQILASNEEAAYRLFETLNDRGKDLSVSDLIKNHFFSLTRKDPAKMHASWQNIESAIGASKIPDFLRHNYISQHGNIQKEKLFKRLKEECTTAADALQLVQDMGRHAQLYRCFLETSVNPSLGIPESPDSKLTVDDLLEGLKELGITASFPVLISTYRLDPKQFPAVLKALVAHALRYYTIGGLQSGRMGNTYAELAKEIVEEDRPAIDSVRRRLNHPENNITDEEFLTKFVAKNNWSNREARWLLRTIEDHLRKESVTVDNLTLEHVLPQGIFKGNPDEGRQWDVYYNWEPEVHADYVARLGNMTLLKGKNNSSLGKMRFRDKIESANGYAKSSDLHITRMISEMKSWGDTQIDDRSEQLAKWALEIFQI